MSRKKENIILTGFMGVGKTTTGREIAKKMGREFLDTDALIEKREGMLVADIFNRYGEAAFRRMEEDIAVELSARENLVIATGGGFFLSEKNIAMMRKRGEIFTLTAQPAEIVKRIQSDTSLRRPLLQNDRDETLYNTVIRLLNNRLPLYNRFIQVETDNCRPYQIAETVIGLFLECR